MKFRAFFVILDEKFEEIIFGISVFNIALLNVSVYSIYRSDAIENFLFLKVKKLILK